MPNEFVTPPDSEHSHGGGWKGLLSQAEYLEAHLDCTHILSAYDPFTHETRQLVLESPNDISTMVRLLRETAHEWKRLDDASRWN